MAQGLPGSLMYVLYEELCTQAWCSQHPVGFLGNYGPDKYGDREDQEPSTMYSEAEPGSRASGAGEGNLPVIPHHSPSACSQPWGPTMPQHVPRGLHTPWGAGAARCPPAPCPAAAAAPGTRSRGNPAPKNRKHLMQPHVVGRPVGARWRRRPPQAHSV